MKGKGREMWCREGEKVGSKHTPISFRFVHSNYHATMTYKKRKEKREKKNRENNHIFRKVPSDRGEENAKVI